MQGKGKTRKGESFSRSRKKEDQAQINREKAMKEKLAHLQAVRLAQKSSAKEPSK